MVPVFCFISFQNKESRPACSFRVRSMCVCGFGTEKRKASKGAWIQFLRSLASWLFLVRCLFKVQVNWTGNSHHFSHRIPYMYIVASNPCYASHLAIDNDTKRKEKRQMKMFKKNIQWPSYKCTLCTVKKKREKHVAKWINGEEAKRKLAPCRAHKRLP